MNNANNSYSSKSPHGSFVAGVFKNAFRIVPDRIYLSIRYKKKLHKACDFKNPASFNEKLQWLKLNDRKKLFTSLCDKIESKEIVANLIGSEHIVPTLEVYDNLDEIDLYKLPDRFVLKCNHDCGSINICRDKQTFDLNKAKKSLKSHIRYNYYNGFREWPYKDIKRKVFAEQYIESEDGTSMVDYKFYCFNGVPKFLYVSKGLEDHSTASISFFDLNGKRMPFKRSDFKEIESFELPKRFPEMIGIAEKLAKFSTAKFIRIDLYTINGKIYFSEFTFFPCGGFTPFEPESADLELGKMIDLNNNRKANK